MNNIGKIIREERLNKNMKQEELAQLIGVTQDSISLWENGKRIPDTQYIMLLCKALDIAADYLLGLEDSTLKVRIFYKIASKLPFNALFLIK